MNLVKAAAANDLLSTRLLLENGADAEGRYPWSSWSTPSPLFPASSGAIPVTPSDPWPRVLPQDVIEHAQYDASPLHVAVLGGHYEVVKLLVEAGADIMGKDGRGRTPITCAIYGLDTLNITAANLPYISQCHPSHVAIVRYLVRQPGLRKGLSRTPTGGTDASSSSCETAFSPRGSQRRLASMVETASQRRPIDRPQEEINGITPLCLAAYLGKDVIVNALLKDGSASVDARDKNGATALMYAARDGHVPVVEALLFHGALPDANDDNGWSAIQYGQMYRQIVRSFEGNLRVRRGAAIEPVLRSFEILNSYTEHFGKLYVRPGTAMSRAALSPSSANVDPAEFQAQLVFAIKRHDYPVIQNLLLALRKQVADYSEDAVPLLVNFHDPTTGLTPMHHAVRAKPAPSPETLVALYQAGADVNAQTHYGRTPLHHLCHLRPGAADATSAFADEQAPSKPRATPRHLAQCAVLLLAFGALLSVPDRHGNTPLHFAAEVGGYLPVAKILVRAGADINRRNARGLRPCDVAKNPEMKKCLQQGSGLQVTNSPSVSSNRSEGNVSEANSHGGSSKADGSGTGQARKAGSSQNGRSKADSEVAHARVDTSRLVPAAGQEDVPSAGSKRAPILQKPERVNSDIRRLARTENNTNSYIAAASANRTSNPLPPTSPDSFGHTAGTAYEAELNFDQVVENLEYFQAHYGTLVDGSMAEISRLADAVASSFEYSGDGNLASPSTPPSTMGSHGVRQVLAACSRLRGELEQAYELVVVTNRQHRDVGAWHKAELHSLLAMRRELADRYAVDRSRLAGLFKLCMRIERGLERLGGERDDIERLFAWEKERLRAELAMRVRELVCVSETACGDRYQPEEQAREQNDTITASSARSSSTLVDLNAGEVSVHKLYRKAVDLEEKLLICREELEEAGEHEPCLHDLDPSEPGCVSKQASDSGTSYTTEVALSANSLNDGPGRSGIVREEKNGESQTELAADPSQCSSISATNGEQLGGGDFGPEGPSPAELQTVAQELAELEGLVKAFCGGFLQEAPPASTTEANGEERKSLPGTEFDEREDLPGLTADLGGDERKIPSGDVGDVDGNQSGSTTDVDNDETRDSPESSKSKAGDDGSNGSTGSKAAADDGEGNDPPVSTADDSSKATLASPGEMTLADSERTNDYSDSLSVMDGERSADPDPPESMSQQDGREEDACEVMPQTNSEGTEEIPESMAGAASHRRDDAPGSVTDADGEVSQAPALIRRVKSLKWRLESWFSEMGHNSSAASAAPDQMLSLPLTPVITSKTGTKRSEGTVPAVAAAGTGALEEHNSETLDLYCDLLAANVEEAARDVADCESRLSRVQHEKRHVCARLVELDRVRGAQSEAAVAEEDEKQPEIARLMGVAEELCAEHGSLIAERRNLEAEMEEEARQLESVKAALALKEPRELLRMLLSRLDGRLPAQDGVRVVKAEPKNTAACCSRQAMPATTLLDARLRLQSLDTALFAVRMLAPQQIRAMQRELVAAKEVLSVVEGELVAGDAAVAQLEPRIAGARDVVRHLLSRVNGFIQDRKDYLERRWDAVYDLERAGREADGELPAGGQTQPASLATASSSSASTSSGSAHPPPEPTSGPAVQHDDEEFRDEEELVIRQDEMRRKEQDKMAKLAARIAQVAPTLEVLATSSSSSSSTHSTSTSPACAGGSALTKDGVTTIARGGAVVEENAEEQQGDEDEDVESNSCEHDVREFRPAHAEILVRVADLRASLRGALSHRSRRGAAHLLERERARLLGRPGVSGLVPEIKAFRRYLLDLRERHLAVAEIAATTATATAAAAVTVVDFGQRRTSNNDDDKDNDDAVPDR